MREIFFLLPLLLLYELGIAQFKTNLDSARRIPDYIFVPKDAQGVFAIWPDKFVPATKDKPWKEQSSADFSSVRNVMVPTLTLYKPKKENGTTIIVAPGGAFHFLSMKNEGTEVAKWLNESGITVFILRYRLAQTPASDLDLRTYWGELSKTLPVVDSYEFYPPSDNPIIEEARLWAEEDGRQAIRFLRQHAIALGINPQKIGIMGFSAGGGVAVNAALRYDEQSHPDFVGGIYPGYRVVSPVPKNLPPLFIATADNDNLVSPMSTSRLYEDWHKNKQPVELHVFANGGHGFGMGKENTLTMAWKTLFESWMKSYGFLP